MTLRSVDRLRTQGDVGRNPEAAELDRHRRARVLLEARSWSLVHDAEGCFLETLTARGERLPVARFLPGATQDEMEFVADAPARFDFMDGLLRRAAAKVRELAQQDRLRVNQEREKDPKNFAAEASMKCDEAPFQRFLAERHGLEPPLTKDRTTVRLRTLLGISSRKELNVDGDAAERWKRLRGEFDVWRRGR